MARKANKAKLRRLRAILSWMSRPISWLYRTLMDWRFGKIGPGGQGHCRYLDCYCASSSIRNPENLAPWIHSLLDEIGIRLPTPSQEEKIKFIRPVADKYAGCRGLVWCVSSSGVLYSRTGRTDPKNAGTLGRKRKHKSSGDHYTNLSPKR